MVDILTPAERSRRMSLIRAKDTIPELIVRRSLHAAGLRYRLHDKKLPGKPDIVFNSIKTAIFVNGCFWHAHTCSLFKLPTTKTEFWREKLYANKARDLKAEKKLHDIGWNTITIWQCELTPPRRKQTLKKLVLGIHKRYSRPG